MPNDPKTNPTPVVRTLSHRACGPVQELSWLLNFRLDAGMIIPLRIENIPLVEAWKRYGDGILKKTFHAQKKEPSIHLSQSFQLRLALSICMYIYIYSIHTYIYMVGGWALPLWKIWLRHLGLWNSQYVESHNPFMFQSTNQNSINLHCCWWNHHFPMVFLYEDESKAVPLLFPKIAGIHG